MVLRRFSDDRNWLEFPIHAASARYLKAVSDFLHVTNSIAFSQSLATIYLYAEAAVALSAENVHD